MDRILRRWVAPVPPSRKGYYRTFKAVTEETENLPRQKTADQTPKEAEKAPKASTPPATSSVVCSPSPANPSVQTAQKEVSTIDRVLRRWVAPVHPSRKGHYRTFKAVTEETEKFPLQKKADQTPKEAENASQASNPSATSSAVCSSPCEESATSSAPSPADSSVQTALTDKLLESLKVHRCFCCSAPLPDGYLDDVCPACSQGFLSLRAKLESRRGGL